MTDAYITRLARCISRMDGKYYDYAKRSMAAENEVYVLYTLSDGGEHSQKNICDDWHIPKTTVNTVANKMRADGYIEFTKTDGREKLMKLTPKGTEYAERALTVIHSAENYAIKRTLERYSAAFVDAMEAFTAFFMEFDDGYDG